MSRIKSSPSKVPKPRKVKAGSTSANSPRLIDGMRPEFLDSLIELYEEVAVTLGGEKAKAKIAAAKKKALAARKRRKAA